MQRIILAQMKLLGRVKVHRWCAILGPRSTVVSADIKEPEVKGHHDDERAWGNWGDLERVGISCGADRRAVLLEPKYTKRFNYFSHPDSALTTARLVRGYNQNLLQK